MRALHFLILIIVVVLLSTEAEGKTKKKKRGCVLNNKVYKVGRTAYKDKAHCLKLKCAKEKNRKGKVKYRFKPKTYRNCKCFPMLCRGKRCSPPEPCPACTAVWEPVCGTNNVTYSNECQLWANNVPCGSDDTELLHYGECGECPEICLLIYKPVCGSDGNTYGNECTLMSAACNTTNNITMVHEGSCDEKLSNSSEDPIRCGKCTKEWVPVCGSNGVTYDNQCYLDADVCRGENVSLVHKGSCDDPEVTQESVHKIKSVKRGKCKYNGKNYNAGDMIEDLIDFCLTVACQPTKNIRKSKVVFQDFQAANACQCSSDRLRKRILRLTRMKYTAE